MKDVPLYWMNSKISETMRDRAHHHRKAIMQIQLDILLEQVQEESMRTNKDIEILL